MPTGGRAFLGGACDYQVVRIASRKKGVVKATLGYGREKFLRLRRCVCLVGFSVEELSERL